MFKFQLKRVIYCEQIHCTQFYTLMLNLKDTLFNETESIGLFYFI